MRYVINGKFLEFSKIQVMGILNFTPDSFFDGGKYFSIFKAIDHVSMMVKLGASFIDIGGESTRPRAVEISEDEETDRVVPIIYEITKRFDVFISVNTSKCLVIRESAKAGAHLINDIRSLSEEGALGALLDYSHLSVCLVHMQGSPNNMQNSPHYSDVVSEINDYFVKKIAICTEFGIDKNRLLLDPGFGFGKTLVHNYQLLTHLSSFHHFNLPLVIGLSRKSMFDLIGDQSPDQRLIGSLAGAVIAGLQGIQILRVHDVKETMEALKIVYTTLKTKGKYFV